MPAAARCGGTPLWRPTCVVLPRPRLAGSHCWVDLYLSHRLRWRAPAHLGLASPPAVFYLPLPLLSSLNVLIGAPALFQHFISFLLRALCIDTVGSGSSGVH